eukprot:TRINITY_DN13005_c0_g1_i1.p1 TRINITY_DN13005_c0_g1~~TRINITY_DN13005_c0_g1_i1.p1  ORF type:complete len:148 (-),score=26.72 TRINITY_DN13005_c0_g1_i1:90-533(-)
MIYFLIFLTVTQVFLMSRSLPVLTYVDLVNHHPDTDDLENVDHGDDLYHEQDHLSNMDTDLFGWIESEQPQDDEKRNPSTVFIEKLLPSSHPVTEYKPQATKRGGKMFDKRTRKYTGCLINLGLGHNCDYREAIGAAQESQHWDSVG